MTDTCFTYGSLMCEDIMSSVAGMTMQGEPATLQGHARHPVRDEDYPGMVPDARGRVEGRLYRGLSEGALVRLDRFEGDMYERRQVRVLSRQGVTPAWTYIFRPAFVHLLMVGDWSFESFLREGKARFERRYIGFDTVNG
jgi:gamma-glutamylcyclotransferase (GGCT)/AIG2-like uncharacterized protein YtfP